MTGPCLLPREMRSQDLTACTLSPAGALFGTLAKVPACGCACRTRHAVSRADGWPAPSPPETHEQIIPSRGRRACARCGFRLGNARVCAHRASNRAMRTRRVPRITRSRDTIEKPGEDGRWTPGQARVRVVRPFRRCPDASTCEVRFRASVIPSRNARRAARSSGKSRVRVRSGLGVPSEKPRTRNARPTGGA